MIENKPLPPLEELKEFLDYNPDTGVLTWKKQVRNSVKIGEEAGCRQHYKRDTRIRISINSKLYLAHRLAYYMYHGIDPLNNDVDHEDRNSLNNKISNNSNSNVQPSLFSWMNNKVPSIIWDRS